MALAHKYGVPEYVAAEAIKLLKAEGIVETRRRVGSRPKAAGRGWASPDGVPQRVHIARTIKNRIDTGAYPSGALLPKLEALAREFDVSPTVTSEALRPLKEDGLLRNRAFKGIVVTGKQDHSPVASDQPTDQGEPQCIPCP
jgi:DNA-binding GntR family transcriptional regulator